MEDSKNSTKDTQISPHIMSLKALYDMNIIYVMFILNGNKTNVSKSLDMSVRSLRDNLKQIEKRHQIQFPSGGANYKSQYIRYNHPDLKEEDFLEKASPKKYIKKLQVFVSDYGFPYREIVEPTKH